MPLSRSPQSQSPRNVRHQELRSVPRPTRPALQRSEIPADETGSAIAVTYLELVSVSKEVWCSIKKAKKKTRTNEP